MKLLLVFFSFCFSTQSLAHDNEEFRILQEFSKGGEYQAWLLVREDGHVLGQPYQVEMRVNCSKVKVQPLEAKVKDSFSVCDLDPDSLKQNRQGSAVALKTKMANIGDYYEKLGRGPASTVLCQEKTTIKKFSLKNLCD